MIDATADTQVDMRAIPRTDPAPPPSSRPPIVRPGMGVRDDSQDPEPAHSASPERISRATFDSVFLELQHLREMRDMVDELSRAVGNVALTVRQIESQTARGLSSMTAIWHEVGGPPEKGLEGKTILLVEDNVQVADTQHRVWTDAGVNLVLHRSMASAMAWLDRCTRLDAAIVDIRLPEGERAGLLVAERVSHQWPDAAIVITTGYYAPQYKPDADRIGAALLPKPYSIAAARAALLGELP